MGGLLPWEYRIDHIVNTLKEQNADIICLQELFSRKGAEQLCEKLKDSYAHFYINIGPIIYGFNKETAGIPSGLFVASKYPLSSPEFQPYNEKETPKIRANGFFHAKIMDQNKALAHIITTHLQSNSADEDLQYRHAQLQAIIHKDFGRLPVFVCGDLNIEKTSAEYQREILPNFIDCYRGCDWTCCELRDFWWEAEQNAEQFNKLDLDLERIDYFLQLKNSICDSIRSAVSNVLPVNNLLDPKKSLSDHQIMISQIIFNE